MKLLNLLIAVLFVAFVIMHTIHDKLESRWREQVVITLTNLRQTDSLTYLLVDNILIRIGVYDYNNTNTNVTANPTVER